MNNNYTNTERLVLDTILNMTGETAELSDDVAFFFDSLSLVDFALELAKKINNDSLLSEKAFFEVKTVADAVAIVQRKVEESSSTAETSL